MASGVQDRIREMVRARWATARMPFTLADLGYQLARDYSRDELQREFLGGKLKNYIEYNLGHELRIVRNPANKIMWGVVPKDVTETDAVLFSQTPTQPEKSSEAESSERTPYVRYDHDLWKAFTTSFFGDRYIELGDRVVVTDLPKGSKPPENSTRLDPEDVSSVRDGYLIVSRKIEAWAQRYGLDISRYKLTSRLGKRTLLEFIIEALSDDELKQLALPMNVIKILNSKRI
jgi:hypothetical protein